MTERSPKSLLNQPNLNFGAQPTPSDINSALKQHNDVSSPIMFCDEIQIRTRYGDGAEAADRTSLGEIGFLNER